MTISKFKVLQNENTQIFHILLLLVKKNGIKMAVTNEFLEFVLDQLSAITVTHKKMFGGAGLYRNGKIFGLIADETVFLKVNDSNKKQYIDRSYGCHQGCS